MPRPKPPTPLRSRSIRLSDVDYIKFKELGGITWLRQYINSKAKFPAKYYEVFSKQK
jgi:hypothetical protein